MRRITAFALLLAAALLFGYQCLPATGVLYVRPLGTTQTYQAITIKTYDATASIQDQVAVTHVDQTFHNNLNNRVEATFIFPLPDGAVITELVYWFNGKRYVASLRERQEAQRAYNERVRERIDPALLQYFGDNTFKLNIAPIDPNSDVRFEITYAELLRYEFGAVTYRFPLKTTGLSPTPLDRVSVRVDATTGKTFKTFTSPSHGNTTANAVQEIAPNHYTVTFGDEHYLPDRDLIIRYETRRSAVDLSVLTYRPMPADSFGQHGFYAMWITPPDSAETSAQPRNIVFTADISSSMEGKRIEQLKAALTSFLDALEERDRFNIVVFSTNAQAYRSDLVQATSAERAGARAFVDQLGAVGLTNIDAALRTSLAMSYPANEPNILVFMTDGYPTWGEQNIRAIVDSATARNDGRARIFPFGIGDEISKGLLDDLALRNGGFPTYIGSDDSIATAVQNYFKRVATPVLSNLEADYGGLVTSDRYPSVLPNLFWGNQVLQFGRYSNSGTFPVTVTANRLGERVSITGMATFDSIPGGNRAVARLWAKFKIDALLEQIRLYGEHKELVAAVIDLSIRFGILTPYTALYSDPNEGGGASDVEETLVPARLSIAGAFPNPFTERTLIRFMIPPGAAHRSVAIYDLNGRLVRTLVPAENQPGLYSAEWDGHDENGVKQPAGMYLCRVEWNGQSVTQSVVLVR